MDDAYNLASQIVADATSNLEHIKTEEDAKIQIITRFLTECLGWRLQDIEAEVKHDNGYSDYLLSDVDRPTLLVEAKRLGSIQISAQERGRLRHLKISGPSLKSALTGIDQAAKYASPNGIPVAVLTDGMTWIVFKTFVPGENFNSKEAFVYPTLDAVLADFATFFDLLSKDQVRKKIYSPMFDELHNRRLLLQTTLVAPLEKNEIKVEQKSSLAFDLEQVFSEFFTRLRGDEDANMLIECFVETRESRIADFSLEKITANVLGNLSPADKDVGEELENLIETAVDIETGQTVFIVGPTGAGKSTFLDRFFRKTLSSNLRKQCLISYVNCLDFSGQEDTALHWITETLIESLEKQVYEFGSPTFNELQGLYYSEYQRRAKGVDAPLYVRDRDAFKEKFAEYLDQVVESDREGYLRRILTDIVRNRKKLPILVIDNTDEFSLENKKRFFQFTQAMARHSTHCLLIFPVTDKSAWSFSKTDIFGIYQSRSFFLPTPPPREVFRKRIEYLKERLSEKLGEEKRRSYFAGRGIKVSIKDMGGFAHILESVFVDQDYTSKTIGELSNYNIRRTLLLSKRVITSSVFKVEDLLKSYFIGEAIAPTFTKFINALMKGDYNVYRPGDCYEIFPVFQVDTDIRRSPLLVLRILELLESARQGGRNVDDRHLSVHSIIHYFDATGCSESSVDRALLLLFEAGLLESFDASVRDLSPGQRLAISYSGRAHLRLAIHNKVFLEQMALTTAIHDEEVARQIRDSYLSNGSYRERMLEVRQAFIEYLISEDAMHLTVSEELPQYLCQIESIEQLKKLAQPDNSVEDDVSAVLGEEFRLGTFKEGVIATVDWFDNDKGFGFADVYGVEGQAFLHASTLQEAGIDGVSDGDDLLCDVSRDNKGVRVSKVYDIQTNLDHMETVDCKVIRLYPDRGYGFVRIIGSTRDAFFHYSAIPKAVRDQMDLNSQIRAEICTDKRGRGLQVRKIIAESSRSAS